MLSEPPLHREVIETKNYNIYRRNHYKSEPPLHREVIEQKIPISEKIPGFFL